MSRHAVNILIFGLLLVIVSVCGFVGADLRNALRDSCKLEGAFRNELQEQWRAQARRQLTGVKSVFEHDVLTGEVNPADDKSLQQWSMVNLAPLRNGGKTSDAFGIELGQRKFLWDGSPDCALKNYLDTGRYIEGQSAMHQDPLAADRAYTLMEQGFSTDYGTDAWWLFDDSRELLEWIVLPKDRVGFGDEPMTIGGMLNPKYRGFLIQLGTQADEIMDPYKGLGVMLEEHQRELKKTMRLIDIIMVLCLLNAILTMTFILYFSAACGGANCERNRNKT